ncbi:aspartate--tRNA ligase [Solibaculum mannosilyticum]|uniref:aspartate--tRNA ligase n=1 Tax=Solibaculum mannosilyticum TaxID=2780922 RepID=UPI0034B8E660
MAETMQGLSRTLTCGDARESHIGKTVTVCGWVQRQRDLGGLIFVDLRDRTGIVQLAFDDNTDRAVFEKASTLRSEYVIAAVGEVRARSAVNNEIPTGKVEVAVTELRILSLAETPPFEISDDCNAREELRLKYRYLDLRRPSLQRNLRLKHQVMKATRDYFDAHGFLELETPMLIRSTPEGARDFLVPSRLHNGEFYALPQSPQLYKQLLMVSGCDRYMQLARCFRDEDLRADRQPEFTQIDLEMSFVSMEDILELGEGYVSTLFKEVLGVDIPLPLPRMTYAEAMSRFGSDKPDTRFGMEITDVSDLVKDCGFGVFSSAVQNGGSVRGIVAKGAAGTLSRKEMDKLTEFARGIGAKGMAWVRWVEDKPASSFGKFFSAEEMDALLARLGAEKGDAVLMIADKNRVTLPVLGALRLEVARKLDIIPDTYNFLWITEFPFFEWDEETETWVAMHHPFTAPMDECIPLLDSDPGAVRAKAYDLVLNGVELSSGSIRITDPELQDKMFHALGLGDEEIQQKFGFLTSAFQYGAPPHGGLGIGLDRLVMLMAKADSIREVIPFPKVQNARELMTSCPSPVDQQQLDELGLCITHTEQKEEQ